MPERVVLCGGIADYNATEQPPGPKNYLDLIAQRGRMEGFIMLDFMSRAAEAIGALAGFVQAGKVKYKVDVQHGLENAPVRPLTGSRKRSSVREGLELQLAARRPSLTVNLASLVSAAKRCPFPHRLSDSKTSGSQDFRRVPGYVQGRFSDTH
jgi:hypothetical protein